MRFNFEKIWALWNQQTCPQNNEKQLKFKPLFSVGNFETSQFVIILCKVYDGIKHPLNLKYISFVMCYNFLEN